MNDISALAGRGEASGLEDRGRAGGLTDVHPIGLDRAPTLYALFVERVKRSAERQAYRWLDPDSRSWLETSWGQMGEQVTRWQAALRREALQPGDRVAVTMRNSTTWIAFDQAALGLGLVVVPLYTNDRPDNVAYCLEDSGAKLLLIEGEVQWKHLHDALGALLELQRVVHVQPLKSPVDARVMALSAWLDRAPVAASAQTPVEALAAPGSDPDRLATIVYTSGTTGRPKGVMLSHRNILWDAAAVLKVLAPLPEDRFLSFLPLSHTLERTAGYYLPMMTATPVTFARSVTQLGEDLKQQRPTVIVSVPRVFELLYGRIMDQVAKRPAWQRGLFRLTTRIGWRRFQRRQAGAGRHPGELLWPLLQRRVAQPILERFGGRLRVIVSGGAALSAEVAELFIGLGLPLLQGYGLTEHSPVISVNLERSNDPNGVGPALPGVEVRIGPDRELRVRSPAVMRGYWGRPEASAEMVDAEGWLHTGDQARVAADGHLHITGRIKDILVLSNGEKVPPGDMEMAITLDPLLDRALVVGEGQHFLGALLNLNPAHWRELAEHQGLDPDDPASLRNAKTIKRVLKRIGVHTKGFPGYAQIRAAALVMEPWTVENGLLTPTLKLRRARILEHHRTDVERLYAGRG
jgi:long-chain acyl-CoA synthetase